MAPLGIDLHRAPEKQTSKINSGEGAGFSTTVCPGPDLNKTQSRWVRPQKTPQQASVVKTWAGRRHGTHDKLVKDGWNVQVKAPTVLEPACVGLGGGI